ERGRGVLAPRRHHGRWQHRVLPRVPQRAAQGPVEAGDPVAATALRRCAPKPPEGVREVRAETHIPILHGYGMTGCPMITSGAVGDDDEQLANPDGAPVLGCEVQVVGDDGKPVPAGVTGEVRVRGAMLAKGYTDPELSAAAFGADGFFTTGDRGY